MFIRASTWRRGRKKRLLECFGGAGTDFGRTATPFVLPNDTPYCLLHCFSGWSGLRHHAPISYLHGEGLDSHNVCVCMCVCLSILCGCVCLYWGCELLSAVIPSGGKANWFAFCSPMFDPTACSAVSLFGNLWHADDRTILMRAHTHDRCLQSEQSWT